MLNLYVSIIKATLSGSIYLITERYNLIIGTYDNLLSSRLKAMCLFSDVVESLMALFKF